ncbi:unnamed protein product [Oncorhynchus mykiss]|uniref:WW domain-containing protein n=1 Tax=Oncorhynchus mykiss TaxID=8022 RepID=A0A060YY23_ONCMY|nr:unnamed protein product [Oncorhynchus mykiss]
MSVVLISVDSSIDCVFLGLTWLTAVRRPVPSPRNAPSCPQRSAGSCLSRRWPSARPRNNNNNSYNNINNNSYINNNASLRCSPDLQYQPSWLHPLPPRLPPPDLRGPRQPQRRQGAAAYPSRGAPGPSHSGLGADPSQALITELGMTSPSSTSQPPPVSNLSSISQHIHQPTTPLELHPGTAQQYAQQPSVAGQDPGVGVLSAVSAPPQVSAGQGSYATLWDPTTQQAVTVQTQVAPQYQVVPAPPPTQTAIYYQGQPCQTIYSIPTAYPQANTPVLQAYADPAANYLHGQPVYTGHQQGVVVQQGGTTSCLFTCLSSSVQEMPNTLLVPNSMIDLPPPSPPKPKTIVLPPSWKVARDGEGKIYYYHVITR